jgi:AraC-like DNA-binding protein
LHCFRQPDLGVPEFYLIKSIEVTTRKTPKQIINERILQEADVLLKNSNWSISEIAFALGFTTVTHFNNFLKKHRKQIPLGFRVA